jgi:predicted nucleic acid-binding protein
MNLKKYNVFSNTTPIIALASIGRLELLPTFFKEITIAEAVKDEINAGGKVEVPNPDTIEWIKIKKNITDIKEKLLFDLDEGEKQSILIAIDTEEKGDHENLLLIDERKGRKIATSLGVKIKGTLGILAEAKRRGLIDNFKKYALKLLENNLYYDLELIDAISQAVDE